MEENNLKKDMRIKEIKEDLENAKTTIGYALEAVEEEYDDIIADVAVCNVAMDRLQKIYDKDDKRYLLEIVDNMRLNFEKIGIKLLVIQETGEEGN